HRLEDLRVRPERHRGAGRVRRLALDQRPGLGRLVLLAPEVAALLDLHGHPDGQRVHHGDADAVQTSGDGVSLAVELSARVQHGQRHLDTGLLQRRVQVDREATPVVDHPDAAVLGQNYIDGVAVAGERLIHRVVHDLPDEVVEPTFTGGPDIHAWSFAHRIQ